MKKKLSIQLLALLCTLLVGFTAGFVVSNRYNATQYTALQNPNLQQAISKFNSFIIALDKYYYVNINHNQVVNTAIQSVLNSLDNFSTVIPVSSALNNNTKLSLSNNKNNNQVSALTSFNSNNQNKNVIVNTINNTLYIKINSFVKNTSKVLQNKVLTVLNQNPAISGVILDLQNNPGGYLNEGVATADIFLEYGLIATVPNYKSNQNYNSTLANYTATALVVNKPLYSLPMYVLVNNKTASAAELVAGTLQNNNRAIVVGQPTVGKNLIQSTFYLQNNFAIKLTTASYILPPSKHYKTNNFNGIKPNILVKNNILDYTINIIQKSKTK